jgi:hypothetical protein
MGVISSFKGGWIYAAQEVETPLVKIGFTWGVMPMRRLLLLWREAGAPVYFVGLVRVASAVCAMERRVHAYLAPYRIHGEWFYLHMNQSTLEAIVTTLRPDHLRQVATDKAIRDAEFRAQQARYFQQLRRRRPRKNNP